MVSFGYYKYSPVFIPTIRTDQRLRKRRAANPTSSTWPSGYFNFVPKDLPGIFKIAVAAHFESTHKALGKRLWQIINIALGSYYTIRSVYAYWRSEHSLLQTTTCDYHLYSFRFIGTMNLGTTVTRFSWRRARIGSSVPERILVRLVDLGIVPVRKF